MLIVPRAVSCTVNYGIIELLPCFNVLPTLVMICIVMIMYIVYIIYFLKVYFKNKNFKIRGGGLKYFQVQ